MPFNEYNSFEQLMEEFNLSRKSRPLHRKVIDGIASAGYRLSHALRHIFSAKYKLEKEHKLLGLTYWDRPKKSIDDFDALTTLAWQTYPILYRFYKAERFGTPVEFTTDYEQVDSAEWDYVISQMVYAFKLLIEKDDVCKSIETMQYEEAMIKKGLELYAKHFQNLWD